MFYVSRRKLLFTSMWMGDLECCIKISLHITKIHRLTEPTGLPNWGMMRIYGSKKKTQDTLIGVTSQEKKLQSCFREEQPNSDYHCAFGFRPFLVWLLA